MSKLLTVLLCTLAVTTYGQTNFLDLGVEGGFSLASLRGNDIVDKYHSTRIGYSGGLFVQYNFRKIISVRSGAYYEEKGSSFEFQFMNVSGQSLGSIHGKESFEYLTVPLLLRATFGNKINYFINAGPYISFLLKQAVTSDAPPYILYPEPDPDHNNIFKKNETGLTIGIGLSYPAKKKFAFSFELRDNLGLSNISQSSVINDGTIKTNSLNFLLGFAFKLGQRNSDKKSSTLIY